jgi:glutamate dehydrogenase/leucine dehydrogenase
MARAQYDQALPYADVSQMVAERLNFPERAVIVAVPLRRDDGTIHIFAGYRVQHSTVLGPTKGGIRYDAEVSLRRRERRDPLRSRLAFAARARAADAPLHIRARARNRSADRHPRA